MTYSPAPQPSRRSRSTRGRSHSVTPSRAPRPGTPWWAYVILAIVAAAAIGLAILALTHDYHGAAHAAALMVG